VPTFDDSTIGGELAYDFTKWNGPKGTVPEPPRFAVNRLLRKVDETFKDLGLKDTDDTSELGVDDVADTMNKIDDEEKFVKLQEALLDALAELCDGNPSREVLEALPYRPFQGFFGYLIGNLTNPEVSVSGTSNSQRRLKSV
jgi:hypothetical protein